jgi:hypothetical protein
MKMSGLFLLALCVQLNIGQAQRSRVLKEITVHGTGYERGFQHGEQLKTDIAEIVAKWKAGTTAALGRAADETLDDFFEYADFTGAIKKWTPDLYDEVRGIADGSGQDFRDVFVLNLLDEFWVYVDSLENHHCSAMGVPATDGRPAIVAQNMDLERYTDGYQVLMRIPADARHPEQMILTYAGLIGLNGMNSAGVGVCVNTMMQLSASATGLPVAFVVRGLTGKSEKTNILEFVQEVEHASGQNYIIGIRDEVFDFEASAGKVVRFEPGNANGTVYHTNHPLVNDDVKPWYASDSPAVSKDNRPEPGNSQYRLEAVKKRVVGKRTLDGESIKETLRSKDHKEHPVCRSNRKNKSAFTFASVIMTLSDNPILEIVAGPPDESEYSTYTFKGPRDDRITNSAR